MRTENTKTAYEETPACSPTGCFIFLNALLFLLCFNTLTLAQTGSANGYVFTTEGKPAVNLGIIIEETHTSTWTNDKGYFEIHDLNAGDYTLKIFAGEQLLQTETITVQEADTTQADFTIRNFSRQYISEIMITGSKNAYVTELPSPSLRLGDPLIEIPQNITVINAKTIKDIGANTTDDILRTASGVLPSNNAGQDIYTIIRGSTTSNSILRNGIGSGYYYNMNPDPSMIDRVEFVKGPAGFMISNANPGGMINIVTKQPTHQKTLNAEIGYGSWDMLRTTIDLGGEIPKSKVFTYRFNAGIQNQKRQYRHGYFTKYFAAGAFKYEPGTNTDIILEYNFTHGKSLDDVRYLPSVNGELYVVPDDLLISDPNAAGITSYDHYLKLSFRHRFSRHWYLNAYAGAVQGAWNANGLSIDVSRDEGAIVNDTIYRYAYKDNFNNRLYNAVAFLQGTYAIGKQLQNTVLAGLDIGRTSVSAKYLEQKERNMNLYYPAPEYYLPKNEIQNFDADVYPYTTLRQYKALYLQDNIKAFGKFTLTLAVRYTTSNTMGFPDTSILQTDKKLTPRLGLTYSANKNLSFYAVMDEAFIPQVGKSLSQAQFKPLTGNNKEIGIKSFWFERKLSFNASVYRTVRNNALTPDPDDPNFQVTTGQSITKGVELDIIGQVNKNISLLANYSYIDARVTKSNKPDEIGLYTFNAPVHSIANLFVRYRLTDKMLDGLSFSIGLQYKDKFSSSRTENAYLPGYILLEAGAGYTYRKWYANLNVYNLTNARYINFGSKYNATDWIYSPGMPLNFRLGIGFRL